MTVSTIPLSATGSCIYVLPTKEICLITGQLLLHFLQAHYYHLTVFSEYVVSCGRHKPLIGQHDTETTTGQTQQQLIMLSATDVTWFRWHIVSVDKMNG